MEAGWFESCRNGCLTGELPVVVCLSFCGRDIAQGFHQAVVVEPGPGDPFEGRQLNGSRASRTKSVCIELLSRQPTIRRVKTSMTKATYSQPCQVDRYVNSGTQSELGQSALKTLLTRSNGHGSSCARPCRASRSLQRVMSNAR